MLFRSVETLVLNTGQLAFSSSLAGTAVAAGGVTVNGTDLADTLDGTGAGVALVLNAGGGNDVLLGSALDDALDGGSGSDTMTGGAGNDTYFVDNTGDKIVESASGGIDTVRTTLASYSLGTGLENLVYTGASAFTGNGNSAANTIVGGSGADKLDGKGGTDILDRKSTRLNFSHVSESRMPSSA